MNILGFDTTSKFLAIGLNTNKRLYEANLDLGIKHSALLIPKLKQILKRGRLAIEDVDYFAIGLGPGSFTGMRLGVATLKGFAFGLDKPVVGISTLDILSRNIATDAFICPVIDAKRGLAYAALYRKQKRISPYMLVSPAQLLGKLSQYKSEIIFLGDALSLYQKDISVKLGKAIFLTPDLWYPKARHIIEIAKERITAKKFDDPFKLRPIYLYPKECQVRLKK